MSRGWGHVAPRRCGRAYTPDTAIHRRQPQRRRARGGTPTPTVSAGPWRRAVAAAEGVVEGVVEEGGGVRVCARGHPPFLPILRTPRKPIASTFRASVRITQASPAHHPAAAGDGGCKKCPDCTGACRAPFSMAPVAAHTWPSIPGFVASVSARSTLFPRQQQRHDLLQPPLACSPTLRPIFAHLVNDNVFVARGTTALAGMIVVLQTARLSLRDIITL